MYNRRRFFELGQKLHQLGSQQLESAMIDIDDFKAINDRTAMQPVTK
ncbi:MAG TPA: diguanylate cyclase [Chromatiaceae bacterium]|nr:diguanylate cyclase [Chromatiaceae bacterium]